MHIPLERSADTHSWQAAYSQGPEQQVLLYRLNAFGLRVPLSGLQAVRLRVVPPTPT